MKGKTVSIFFFFFFEKSLDHIIIITSQ